MDTLTLNPTKRIPLLKVQEAVNDAPSTLPVGKSHQHPTKSTGKENASIYFIGTATTVLEWEGTRILTDPNFLHAGDHVHLGPGVQGTRKTNPAVDIGQLPPVDCVLLSHYHADHFDQVVEESLNREFLMISTPHAKKSLAEESGKAEPFKNVKALDHWEKLKMDIEGSTGASVKVTAMPGKHVPPGPLSVANDLLDAVPPTNGWMLDLSYGEKAETGGKPGYRIYISGDTLFVDELKDIRTRFQDEGIDLMLIHLGGTSIPSPSVPLLMVTMDAKQGLQLMQLLEPDVTIPIHFDDYDVFLSPRSDFESEVEKAGKSKSVVYLDRGEEYRFEVRAHPTVLVPGEELESYFLTFTSVHVNVSLPRGLGTKDFGSLAFGTPTLTVSFFVSRRASNNNGPPTVMEGMKEAELRRKIERLQAAIQRAHEQTVDNSCGKRSTSTSRNTEGYFQVLKPAVKPQPPRALGFLDLAPEMRNMVYQYACLTQNEPIRIETYWPATGAHASSRGPEFCQACAFGIAQTCKEVAAETLPMIYANTFLFCTLNELDLFLDTIGDLRKHLRRIQITNCHPYLSSEGRHVFEKLTSAKGLQKIRINFAYAHFKTDVEMGDEMRKIVRDMQPLLRIVDNAMVEKGRGNGIFDFVHVLVSRQCYGCRAINDSDREGFRFPWENSFRDFDDGHVDLAQRAIERLSAVEIARVTSSVAYADKRS